MAAKGERYNRNQLFRFGTYRLFDGGIGMRVAIYLVGICLLFSAAAAAQGPAGVGSEGGRPITSASERDSYPWQFAAGYQYNRDNLLGSPFNTHGANFSLARYFRRRFGVEAQVGTGFLGKTGQATTPPNLSSKSVFAGAGPRFSYTNSTRYEPWAHVVIGVEHFRFSQTSALLGSNTALAGLAGIGLDVHLRPHLAVRAEADEMESHYFSAYQRSFQIVAGVAIGF
jgi:hypothetical protein